MLPDAGRDFPKLNLVYERPRRERRICVNNFEKDLSLKSRTE